MKPNNELSDADLEYLTELEAEESTRIRDHLLDECVHNAALNEPVAIAVSWLTDRISWPEDPATIGRVVREHSQAIDRAIETEAAKRAHENLADIKRNAAEARAEVAAMDRAA